MPTQGDFLDDDIDVLEEKQNDAEMINVDVVIYAWLFPLSLLRVLRLGARRSSREPEVDVLGVAPPALRIVHATVLVRRWKVEVVDSDTAPQVAEGSSTDWDRAEEVTCTEFVGDRTLEEESGIQEQEIWVEGDTGGKRG